MDLYSTVISTFTTLMAAINDYDATFNSSTTEEDTSSTSTSPSSSTSIDDKMKTYEMVNDPIIGNTLQIPLNDFRRFIYREQHTHNDIYNHIKTEIERRVDNDVPTYPTPSFDSIPTEPLVPSVFTSFTPEHVAAMHEFFSTNSYRNRSNTSSNTTNEQQNQNNESNTQTRTSYRIYYTTMASFTAPDGDNIELFQPSDFMLSRYRARQERNMTNPIMRTSLTRAELERVFSQYPFALPMTRQYIECADEVQSNEQQSNEQNEQHVDNDSQQHIEQHITDYHTDNDHNYWHTDAFLNNIHNTTQHVHTDVNTTTQQNEIHIDNDELQHAVQQSNEQLINNIINMLANECSHVLDNSPTLYAAYIGITSAFRHYYDIAHATIDFNSILVATKHAENIVKRNRYEAILRDSQKATTFVSKHMYIHPTIATFIKNEDKYSIFPNKHYLKSHSRRNITHRDYNNDKHRFDHRTTSRRQQRYIDYLTRQ